MKRLALSCFLSFTLSLLLFGVYDKYLLDDTPILRDIVMIVLITITAMMISYAFVEDDGLF